MSSLRNVECFILYVVFALLRRLIWLCCVFIYRKTRELILVFAFRRDLKICVCMHVPHAQLNRTTHLLLLNDVDWIQLTQDMFHMLTFGDHCRWSKIAFFWDMTSCSFRRFCCLQVHDRQYKVSLKFWFLSPSTQCDLSDVIHSYENLNRKPGLTVGCSSHHRCCCCYIQ